MTVGRLVFSRIMMSASVQGSVRETLRCQFFSNLYVLSACSGGCLGRANILFISRLPAKGRVACSQLSFLAWKIKIVHPAKGRVARGLLEFMVQQSALAALRACVRRFDGFLRFIALEAFNLSRGTGFFWQLIACFLQPYW